MFYIKELVIYNICVTWTSAIYTLKYNNYTKFVPCIMANGT